MQLSKARDARIDAFTPNAWFTTLTNVNFDAERFVVLIAEARQMRRRAQLLAEECGADLNRLPAPATWHPGLTEEELVASALEAGLYKHLDRDGPTVTGLRALILYGLKGCAAYAEHARVLGGKETEVIADFHAIAAFLADDPSDIDVLLAHALKVGELNLRVMELLDGANTGRFGQPEITSIRITPIKGQCLLVSGHDLGDLETILRQTAGLGINVYTHGELLTANSYPGLKRNPHLVGNYGGAWQDQQREFAAFPGAIVMTSNCLINPEIKGYQDRLFTSGPVGWPGVRHIADHDFMPAIRRAQTLPGFERDSTDERIMIGFGRHTVLGVADTLLGMIRTGEVHHLFVIGGCDGARPGRNYFHDLALATPYNSLVLTLGCGKFRFNREAMGAIGPIPRLLDAGQCNDAYSAVKIATTVANALGVEVNDLPLSLAISWFEQKATAVLLTLLHLGIRNIHLGPSVPQYLTPEVIELLAGRFGLKPTTSVEQDLPAMLRHAA
ncbi:hydroxylamine reductase [Sphingomonas oryzagri]